MFPVKFQASPAALEDAAISEVVRTRDRDRYIAALIAPRAHRPSLLALYAFDSELSRIPGLVSEPMVGQIRLQWWRDAIEMAAPGSKTGNPIADGLARAIYTADLPRDRLSAMVDVRLQAIFKEPPANIAALRSTLDMTAGSVFLLSSRIMGDGGEIAQRAARHAGLAYGMTKLLLQAVNDPPSVRALLPPQYLESRGIDAVNVQSGKENAGFATVTGELSHVALRALSRFRTVSRQLDPATFPAFLPLETVTRQLRAITWHRIDNRSVPSVTNPVIQFLSIWRAAVRGSIS